MNYPNNSYKYIVATHALNPKKCPHNITSEMSELKTKVHIRHHDNESRYNKNDAQEESCPHKQVLHFAIVRISHMSNCSNDTEASDDNMKAKQDIIFHAIKVLGENKIEQEKKIKERTQYVK